MGAAEIQRGVWSGGVDQGKERIAASDLTAGEDLMFFKIRTVGYTQRFIFKAAMSLKLQKQTGMQLAVSPENSRSRGFAASCDFLCFALLFRLLDAFGFNAGKLL